MESFFNSAVIWFLVGFVFLLLEFVVPGLILFFFAVGAWIAALLCLVSDPSINTQLIVFLAAALFSIALFRKWVKRLIYSGRPSKEIIEDEFIGKTGVAATFIGPGQNGKIDFKGTIWDASSEIAIEKGQNVTIIGNESILLIVKPTQTL